MIEYFLHADLLVPEPLLPEFLDTSRQFLARGGFRRLNPEFDNELVLSFCTPAPFQYDGMREIKLEGFARDDRRAEKLPAPVYNVVNLWRVKDLRDLDIAAVMLRSSDDKLYSQLNGLVIRELQNYVIRVRWLNAPLVGIPKGPVFRIQRQFKPGDMGAYLGAAGALFPLLEKEGWKCWGYFQNVTGVLNLVTEFWEKTEEKVTGTVDQAIDKVLRKVEPLRAAFNQERARATLPLEPLDLTAKAQAK